MSLLYLQRKWVHHASTVAHDGQNSGSTVFAFFSAIAEEGGITGNLLQSATTPLDATKFHTLDLWLQ